EWSADTTRRLAASATTRKRMRPGSAATGSTSPGVQQPSPHAAGATDASARSRTTVCLGANPGSRTAASAASSLSARRVPRARKPLPCGGRTYGARPAGGRERRVQRGVRHLPRGVARPERGGERRGDGGPDVGERQQEQERDRRPRRDAAHEEDGERDGEPGERARGKERQQGGEGDRPGDGLARAEPPAEHAVEARPRERGQGEDDDRAPAEEG